MKYFPKVLIAIVVAYTYSLTAICQTNLAISSFSQNGTLIYTEVSSAQYYRVEWASSITGPWSSDWNELKDIPISGAGTNVVQVPMFYRIIGQSVDTNEYSLFDGATLNGWTQNPVCDAWGVESNCITFAGNPVGTFFRLTIDPYLSISNSFQIQMDLCATNMLQVGFDMDMGNRFGINNPIGTWHTVKLVVCVNDSEFQASPSLPAESSLGIGQVRRDGAVALCVWLTDNNDPHLAWFRNISFQNLTDVEAAQIIDEMRNP